MGYRPVVFSHGNVGNVRCLIDPDVIRFEQLPHKGTRVLKRKENYSPIRSTNLRTSGSLPAAFEPYLTENLPIRSSTKVQFHEQLLLKPWRLAGITRRMDHMLPSSLRAALWLLQRLRLTKEPSCHMVLPGPLSSFPCCKLSSRS